MVIKVTFNNNKASADGGDVGLHLILHFMVTYETSDNGGAVDCVLSSNIKFDGSLK